MKITFFNVDLHFLGRHSLFSSSIIGPTTNLLKIHVKSNISFLKVCDIIKPRDKYFWTMRWNHTSNITWHFSSDYFIWWTMIFFLHAALWIVVQICLFWVLTLYTFDNLTRGFGFKIFIELLVGPNKKYPLLYMSQSPHSRKSVNLSSK